MLFSYYASFLVQYSLESSFQKLSHLSDFTIDLYPTIKVLIELLWYAVHFLGKNSVWLPFDRKNSNATRNLRLAAMHAFFKYIQYFDLDNLYEYQSTLSVKVKKQEKRAINYLTPDGIRLKSFCRCDK